jgi:hypothetical protein
MDGGERLRGRRRYRRRAALRSGRRAVVSVVGTLLALLVFFALFGIFITQYVPVWMNDNESAFVQQLQSDFAELKQSVDLQSALGSPASMETPFSLASQGIPLIATPTEAVFNYVPHTQGVYINVSESYGPSGVRNFAENLSLGTVQAYVPDRYYPPQQFQYESDAVIESQTGSQQTLLYPPLFTLNTTGNSTSGTLGLLQLYGNATQVVTTGTVEVYSVFDTTQQYISEGNPATPKLPFQVTVTLGTLYPCAWVNYLHQVLGTSGLGAANYTLTPSTCVNANGQSTLVRLVLLDMNRFDLQLATLTIDIGIGQV